LADLDDILGSAIPPEIEPALLITAEIVQAALYRATPFKAPGLDSIPMGFLQAIRELIVLALQRLAQACWDWEYMLKPLRVARTIATRKPGKSDYSVAKAWRPIALLNIIGKVIKTITAIYLQDLAEARNLLLSSQMGARKNRSTETALDLLLSQVRAT
jgi:hypothetical protein